MISKSPAENAVGDFSRVPGVVPRQILRLLLLRFNVFKLRAPGSTFRANIGASINADRTLFTVRYNCSSPTPFSQAKRPATRRPLLQSGEPYEWTAAKVYPDVVMCVEEGSTISYKELSGHTEAESKISRLPSIEGREHYYKTPPGTPRICHGHKKRTNQR